MDRKAIAAAVIAAALAMAGRALAEEKAAESAKEPERAAPGEEAAPAEPKDYQFLTGLDFSYWAVDEGTTVWGPGITVGFVLLPRHLEMGVTVGAMLGGHQYTIPVELSFTVPFYVKEWLAPYVKLGPTVLTDKVQEETTYDLAVSFGAGLEFLPVGFDWGLYVGGDYNVRTLHDARHQGGFTIGFHYRV
ncbi:MAG: hypothetical protein M0R80_17930 [Proteobacteria bacterium]|jgi:hypothetical protein|nr:hypothetical protein [Pseudomonadota bacterium]